MLNTLVFLFFSLSVSNIIIKYNHQLHVLIEANSNSENISENTHVLINQSHPTYTINQNVQTLYA